MPQYTEISQQIATMPVLSTPQLVNVAAYQRLLALLQRDDLNPYRRKSILDYLSTCLRVNFKENDEINAIILELEQESDHLKEQTKTPSNVIIYFSGTGNPVGLQHSLFDDKILEALEDDACGKIAVKAVPGVCINAEDGSIDRFAFKSGTGMAERIGAGYEFLQGLNLRTHTSDDQSDTSEQTAEIQILGHSRGAIQALALGKLLAKEGIKTSVVAHDPVLGSLTRDAIYEPIVYKEDEQKIYTPHMVLNDAEAKIENLLVILREDENRATAFAFYDNENAYAANNFHVVNHPGFHNCGVFKDNSCTLNLDIMFSHGISAVVSRPVIVHKSKAVNQDYPRIDAHRDLYKEFLYNKMNELVSAFLNHDDTLDDKISAVKLEIAKEHFPAELTGNPAYALLQEDHTRTIPEYLLEEKVIVDVQKEVQKLLENYAEAKSIIEKNHCKKQLLLQYVCFLLTDRKTKPMLAESIFAVLSTPSEGPLNFHSLVRSLTLNDPLKNLESAEDVIEFCVQLEMKYQRDSSFTKECVNLILANALTTFGAEALYNAADSKLGQERNTIARLHHGKSAQSSRQRALLNIGTLLLGVLLIVSSIAILGLTYGASAPVSVLGLKLGFGLLGGGGLLLGVNSLIRRREIHNAEQRKGILLRYGASFGPKQVSSGDSLSEPTTRLPGRSLSIY